MEQRKMSQSKKCTAINALWCATLFAALFAATLVRAAEVVGTVANLSGPLLAKKADGSVKILAQKSSVEQGDTLVSEKNTYARIRFIDNSEITLRPGTQLKVENFSYQADKPEKDSAVFSLVKGGLRSVTGLLGKRNHDRFGLNTPTATIGIRGTIFIAEYIPPEDQGVASYGFASMAAAPEALVAQYATRSDAPYGGLPIDFGKPLQLAQNLPVQPGAGTRAPGLYVQVLDGMIHLSNGGGSQNFSAGQFGYTPSFQQPPVILPANPGIQFSPPPVFSSSNPGPAGSGTGGKSATVDCEVR
jgi:hypothetical protein